jgi:predicted secreted protein
MRPAIVLVVLAAGCSTVWDPHAPKTVTAGDEGGAVTVKHGQRLHLPLATEPGGKYEWRLAEPPVRAVVAEGPADEKGLNFTPVRSGEQQLRLEYRPVSGEGAPQRIVSYDVSVPETGLRAWLRSLFGRRSR